MTSLEVLTKTINKIKGRLQGMSDIEHKERSLLVAATGFKENKVDMCIVYSMHIYMCVWLYM